MHKRFLYFLLVMFGCSLHVAACQCPLTTLSIEECNKYEIIFRGKILEVKSCNNNFGEAVFQLDELYKGNATKQFTVLFECGVACAMNFLPGEEWIIYSNYKQIGNVKMDWCSRSRKFFKVSKQDFYTTTYGNDYDEEVAFLRKNLGLHRVMTVVKNGEENRNIRPDSNQMIITLVCSLLVLILFYWLFNKFFKFKQ